MLPSDNLMSLVLTLLLALAVSVWWGWQRGRRRTLPVLVQLGGALQARRAAAQVQR